METQLLQDKLIKQQERMVFIAGFQAIVEIIQKMESVSEPTALQEAENAMMQTFIEAAINDATEFGFAGEA